MKRKFLLAALSLVGLASSCSLVQIGGGSSSGELSLSDIASEASLSSESSSLEELSSLEESSFSSAEESSLTSGDVSSESSSQGEEYLDAASENEHWEGLDLSKRGNEFRAQLQSLIRNYTTNSCTYKECLSIGAKAASYPEGSSTFVPFYHASPEVNEGVSGNGACLASASECNREHTWPNSRGSGKSGPGADPFLVRPTLTKENSSRQNFFYGYSSSNEWDPSSCGYEGARGEAARVILYAATAYYSTCGSGGSSSGNAPLELSNNPGDETIVHTMGTLKTLLEWNAAYAPSDMEIQINDYLCEQGYGRNPFVDEPRFATYIWTPEGLRD